MKSALNGVKKLVHARCDDNLPIKDAKRQTTRTEAKASARAFDK